MNGHQSDCSTHNEPAYPNGKCDCGYEAQGIADEIRLTEEDQKAIASYINSPTELGYVVHAKPAKEIVEKLFKLSLTLHHLLEKQLEENERLRGDIEAAEISTKAWKDNADECLNHRRKDVEAYRKVRDERNTLRSELAAKDKVLEQIASIPNRQWCMDDPIELACSILLRYKETNK